MQPLQMQFIDGLMQNRFLPERYYSWHGDTEFVWRVVVFFSRQLPLCCTAVVHSRTNHMLQPHQSRYVLALYASFDDVTTTSAACVCVHVVHNCVLGGRELPGPSGG